MAPDLKASREQKHMDRKPADSFQVMNEAILGELKEIVGLQTHVDDNQLKIANLKANLLGQRPREC